MKPKLLGLLAGISLLALAAQPAAANMITLTASGSSSDGALAAEADFTTSAGQIKIVLTNLLPSTTANLSAGQLLSDLSFTINIPPGTLGATSASGQLANISGTGGVTDVSGNPVRWLGQGPPAPGGTGTPISITGNTVTMVGLEALGGGQPSQLILPSGSDFSSANGSVLGGQFNPFVVGPATFTLALSGVTAGTDVTQATFSFGTSPDEHDITVPGPVVGAGLPGLILACGALLALVRRRRQLVA
jgi:hypothetical protein